MSRPPSPLPRLAPGAAYVPMDELAGRPHICVDRAGALALAGMRDPAGAR